MTKEITEVKLDGIFCVTCGINFGIDERVLARLTPEDDDRPQRSWRIFICPNGHSLSFPKGKSALEIERDKLTTEVKSLREKLEKSSKDLELLAAKVVELTTELEIWKPAETKINV